VRQAALVSDESALEVCLRRCTIQTDDFYLLPFYLLHTGSSTGTESTRLLCSCDTTVVGEWRPTTLLSLLCRAVACSLITESVVHHISDQPRR